MSASGSLADATGDATPGYLDIVRVGARTGEGQIQASLTLAAPVPGSTPTVGTLAYAFSLDTDGDGTPDAVVSLENLPEGGFRPVLSDPSSGRRLEGADFPGTAGLAGADVKLGLRLDALGCPATIAIRASSTRTHSGATTGDDAPDPAASPLTVSTGC